jgi:hypothetical protein
LDSRVASVHLMAKPCVQCGAADRYANGNCRPCSSARSRRWNADHPGRANERSRRWAKTNPEKRRETYRRYRKSLISKPCATCGATDRSESGACRPCIKAHNREWAAAHPRNGWRLYWNHDPEHAKRVHREAELRRKARDPELFRQRSIESHRRHRAKQDPEQKREQYRRYNLKKNYGISAEEYAAMLAAQHGLCAICGKPPGRKRLAVDHDHETGGIRLLLCEYCNPGLGFFKHNPDLLRAAIAYLARPLAAKG